MTLLRSRTARRALLIYALALVCYAATSGGRLLRRSPDGDHYLWLARSWLQGRLDLGRSPPHGNDWAQVEHVQLQDGRTLRGAYVSGSRETLRTLNGQVVHLDPGQIRRRETKYYVSFPPFPAVLMLPMVALWGDRANDVVFTVLLAGLGPALFFVLLRRLAARGDSRRSEADDLWLTAVLGVGSVYYYSSVIGQVWYTAHITSVILMIVYLWASLDARRPTLAGLALVCGFLSRPEILFAAPFFLIELIRRHQRPSDDAAPPPEPSLPASGLEERSSLSKAWIGLRITWHRLDKAAFARDLVRFGLPVALLGCGAGVLNLLRFGRFTEFGHTYLNVRWTPRIQRYGLFNYVFLSRNLTCLLALLPRLIRTAPYIQISWHGLAIWFTTPVVLWVLWPRQKGPLHRPLWIATACVGIPDLFYQNSGWVQFGYRFALDYIVFLLCLIAIGNCRFGRWFKLLVVFGIVVNLFGAITFASLPQFYFDGLLPPGID